MTANTRTGQTDRDAWRRRRWRRFAPAAPLLVLAVSLLCLPYPVQADTSASEELSAFSRSRPGVEAVLSESQDVYTFLTKAFTGLYTSVPLAWDSREPNDNAYAEHKPSLNRRLINIRVSSKLNALDQVACIVYEAINAQNEQQFADLTDAAHRGSLTKTEFIHSILSLEHKSLKKTRDFLSIHEPFKSTDISGTVFYSKMIGTPEEFDAFLDYLHSIKRDDYDVFKHYSDFYDFIIPPTKRWKSRERELTGNQESSDSAKDEKTE